MHELLFGLPIGSPKNVLPCVHCSSTIPEEEQPYQPVGQSILVVTTLVAIELLHSYLHTHPALISHPNSLFNSVFLFIHRHYLNNLQRDLCL